MYIFVNFPLVLMAAEVHDLPGREKAHGAGTLGS